MAIDTAPQARQDATVLPPLHPRSSWTRWVVVAASVLVVGCGGDDAVRTSDESTTTVVADASWFSIAAVTAVSDAPCTSDATPSQDGSQCYELADPVVDASGVDRAIAEEDQAPGCVIAPGEIFCVADGETTVPKLPKPGTWSVPLTLADSALDSFNALAAACYEQAPSCPTGQAAIVLDGVVISAPTIQQPGFQRDSIVLSAAFDQSTAERLAARLSG